MTEINDGDIVILHLMNGTSVVTRVDAQDEDGFTCYRPTQLVGIPPQQQGQAPQFALIPFLIEGGVLPPLEQILLGYDAVLLPRPCPAPVEEQYRNLTGMVAVVKNSSLIVTP